MNNYMSPDDDISILPSEDDANATGTSPTFVFNLSASRQQFPSSRGITSMAALKDAYEELKKKYNETNNKYEDLMKWLQNHHPGELHLKHTRSHSLEDKNEQLQINRKDEIEKLHTAIVKLTKELTVEKTKNQELESQMYSLNHGTTAGSSAISSKDIGEMEILDKLMENIQMLEESVDIHQKEIWKMQNQREVYISKTMYNTPRKLEHPPYQKKQLEHDELGDPMPRSEKPKPIEDPLIDEENEDSSWSSFEKDPFKERQKPQKVIDLRQKSKGPIRVFDYSTPLTLRNLGNPSPPPLPPPPAATATTSMAAVPPTTPEHGYFQNSYGNAHENRPLINFSERTESEDIICPYCVQHFPFLSNNDFQAHVTSCSSKEEPEDTDRKCPMCHKSFQHFPQKDFELHVNTHFDQTDGFGISDSPS